jgi:hypothetical protein
MCYLHGQSWPLLNEFEGPIIEPSLEQSASKNRGEPTMPIDKQRAKTDLDYRKGLTPAELAEFESQLTDEDLNQVAGGLMNLKCVTTTGSCLATKRMGC